MVFVGYADRESDSVRMWDMRTSWVVVSRDVIRLKRMVIKDDVTSIIDLATPEDPEAESDTGLEIKGMDDTTMPEPNSDNQSNKLGGTVKWASPMVTGPSTMHTRAGRAIKPPDRLTYAPAVELRYLGEMAELDHGKIAMAYVAL